MNSLQINFIQFNSTQFSSLQFSTVQFSSVQFSSIQFSSIQFSSVQFSSLQFSSIQINSIQIKLIQFDSLHFKSIQINSIQCYSHRPQVHTCKNSSDIHARTPAGIHTRTSRSFRYLQGLLEMRLPIAAPCQLLASHSSGSAWYPLCCRARCSLSYSPHTPALMSCIERGRGREIE